MCCAQASACMTSHAYGLALTVYASFTADRGVSSGRRFLTTYWRSGLRV